MTRASDVAKLITSGGTIVDGNIAFADGHGLDFSATSDASGMTSELLDDYEEGTWTPSFTFSSSAPSGGATTGHGKYTKIGDLVTVFFALNNPNVSGASGDVRINGLPFASLLDTNLPLYSGTFRASAIDLLDNGDGSYLVSEIRDGENFIRIMAVVDDTSANATELTTSEIIHGSTDVFGTITYKV